MGQGTPSSGGVPYTSANPLLSVCATVYVLLFLISLVYKLVDDGRLASLSPSPVALKKHDLVNPRKGLDCYVLE
jgi:hypothetical protein